MTNNFKFNFLSKKFEVKLTLDEYSDNSNLAIVVINCETGDIYTELSTNIAPLPKPLFALDVSVNSELLQVLEEAGVYTKTDSMLYSGFNSYPIAELNEEWLQILEKEK